MSDISDAIEFNSLVAGNNQINEDLILRLLELWKDIFQTDFSHFHSILTGMEYGFNRDVIFLAEKGGRVIGTCHLTQSVTCPELGGLGEVCTLPEFRGTGIASNLCQSALNEFRSAGGKALFLGTSNPAAALIYHRLGWHKLPGANIMVNITADESPEEFLTGYFNEKGKIRIAKGTPAERVTMIPLIAIPHYWQVMDANLGLFSTRYVLQRSCMGLYPRYERLLTDSQGEWFAAKNDSNQTVGLSSARMDISKRCQIDGFAHHKYQSEWEGLIIKAISWAMDQKAESCWVRLSVEDEEKISMFEGSAFKKGNKGVSFDLNGREVGAISMEFEI